MNRTQSRKPREKTSQLELPVRSWSYRFGRRREEELGSGAAAAWH